MTTITQSNANAAHPIAGKFSPAKTGSARSCKNVTADISPLILRENITPRLGPVEIQIDGDLFIAPVTDEEREFSMLYSNHSCDANLGMRGEITFVAMRDIRAGEELTHDWAMTDDDDYSVECKCGAPNCRGILTGRDWQRPELQARYAGYFSAYLARRIAMLAPGP